MAKVKKCTSTGCIEVIELDTNDIILNPKDKCDTIDNPKQVQEYMTGLAKRVRDTIYVTKPLKVKEGDELPF